MNDSASKSSSTSSPTKAQTFYFMFFLKSISLAHQSQEQNKEAQLGQYKFSIYKGQHFFKATKQPIELLITQKWTKVQDVQLNFMFKQSNLTRKVQFIAKMHQVTNEEEVLIGQIAIDPYQYVNTYLNEGKEWIDKKGNFGPYAVKYLVFIDKNIHNINKLAKEYKQTARTQSENDETEVKVQVSIKQAQQTSQNKEQVKILDEIQKIEQEEQTQKTDENELDGNLNVIPSISIHEVADIEDDNNEQEGESPKQNIPAVQHSNKNGEIKSANSHYPTSQQVQMKVQSERKQENEQQKVQNLNQKKQLPIKSEELKYQNRKDDSRPNNQNSEQDKVEQEPRVEVVQASSQGSKFSIKIIVILLLLLGFGSFYFLSPTQMTLSRLFNPQSRNNQPGGQKSQPRSQPSTKVKKDQKKKAGK